jgi:argininosuccinate synthase
VYENIFRGSEFDEKGIWLKPGYRGLYCLPYPKHIRKMIEETQNKINKQNGEVKYPIYAGHETKYNIDY